MFLKIRVNAEKREPIFRFETVANSRRYVLSAAQRIHTILSKGCVRKRFSFESF